MVSRLPPALTLLPQITYSILWPNISVPVPGIPRTCSVADSSSLNPRFFGCRMKIGRMCSKGRPECARSTAIRVATGQRGSSFSTYPIKTCQRWISSECQGRERNPEVDCQERTNAGAAKAIPSFPQWIPRGRLLYIM